MKKFITPVSMKVTMEQYESDLKEALEKLGYEYDSKWNEKYNPSNGKCNLFAYFPTDGKYSLAFFGHKLLGFEGVHIEDYNPEMFLALAAMTEGSKWINGEWLVTKNKDHLEAGHIFKCEEARGAHWQKGLAHNCHRNLYRKLTKEEIISHFNKAEFPKKWCIKGSTALSDWASENEVDTVWNLDINFYYYSPNNSDVRGDWICHDMKKPKGKIEITFEQFIEHFENKDESNIFPFKLNYEDARKIIDSTCETWKIKLSEKWGAYLVQDRFVEVNEKLYEIAKRECDKDQIKLINSILGIKNDKKTFLLADGVYGIWNPDHPKSILIKGSTENPIEISVINDMLNQINK